MSSWQDYVSNLVSCSFSNAALIGYPQGGVWAASPGFVVRDTEQTALIKAFSDPTDILSNGAIVDGKWYYTQRAEDKKIILKIRDSPTQAGALIVRTKKIMIIGAYDKELMDFGTSMGKLEDYLDAVGF